MKNKKRSNLSEIKRNSLESMQSGGGLEGSWPPKWIVTYGDMTTLMMTFFVFWYAFMIKDIPLELLDFSPNRVETKAEVDSLQESKKMSQEKKEVLSDLAKMNPEQKILFFEIKKLQEQADNLKNFIIKDGYQNDIKTRIQAEEIVIVPNDYIVFEEGSSKIKKNVLPLLDKISDIILKTKTNIRIEGHTDSTQIHPRKKYLYPSNWELSTDRAAAVANYFINEKDIAPKRISIAGYSDTKPAYPDSDKKNRSKNRRVEFHINIDSDK